jgi:hypothetical protein
MAEADAVTLGPRDYEDGNTFTISSLIRSVFRHLCLVILSTTLPSALNLT